MFVAPHRGRAYIFADLIFYFYNGQYPAGAAVERWSLMRLSVKNERPLYNAYRGGIRRRGLSLSLSLSLSLPFLLFVSSIRNLISHESERRLSPFSSHLLAPAVFSRRSFLFSARKANRRPREGVYSHTNSFSHDCLSMSTMSRLRTFLMNSRVVISLGMRRMNNLHVEHKFPILKLSLTDTDTVTFCRIRITKLIGVLIL